MRLLGLQRGLGGFCGGPKGIWEGDWRVLGDCVRIGVVGVGS